MAVHVSYSSLCLFHLCALGLPHGIRHKAGVYKSPLNTVSLRDAQQLKISSTGIKWCCSLLFYSWPSVIFPLLTGHMFVFILTDEVQLSHGCDHKPGAVDVRIWCPLSQLNKSWKASPSFTSHLQTLVEHEFAFLPLGLVFNGIF